MSPSHQRQESIFSDALSLPREARTAFLYQACGDDTELLRSVQTLLTAHTRAGAFLEPAVAPMTVFATRPEPADDLAGLTIGHYRLLKRIGEGGAGVVYEAEQSEPVKRHVAIKVARPGMNSPEIVARFKIERQALALMGHPNIAQVFDAGSLPGSPDRLFVVMEFIRGTKITDACDQHALSVAERLRLFIQVCHAVQHAHQKGVIHRDIKPSNILVAIQDGTTVPKIIDFGIAKAASTTGALGEDGSPTPVGRFIGTPAYMSPEQSEWSALDVDTRADIFSLGVLLFELLTGHTPSSRNIALGPRSNDVHAVLMRRGTLRPSRLVAALEPKALAATARRRSTHPRQLIRALRGDIDAIVLKAMERDRALRYDSASALATDLERHMRFEPVEARSAGPSYRLARFLRRNRSSLAASAGIVAALGLGVTLAVWSHLRQARAPVPALSSAGLPGGHDLSLTTRYRLASLAAQDDPEGAALHLALAAYHLASGLDHAGRRAEAAPLYRESLALWSRLAPGLHPDRPWHLTRLAVIETEEGHYRVASDLLDEAWSLLDHTPPPASEATLGGILRAQVALGHAWSEKDPTRSASFDPWRKRLVDFETGTTAPP